MVDPLASTYGVWMVSLILETFLYGMGVLQVFAYFAHLPTDPVYLKTTVLGVLTLETIQIVFFSYSSYNRFVERFGELQLDLIWADSLQLLAAYLGAFVVQIYFASRIHRLTKGRPKFSISAFGIYFILALAFASIGAGIAQTITSYHLRSYLKLDETKFITTIQAASSLACDLLITIFLCVFLTRQKGELVRTNSLMDSLIYDAINRGTLTALSSAVNMILFLALPGTFWFFIGLAPSSKLYMNSMLATLNGRESHRAKMAGTDKGWNSIAMASIPPDVHDTKISGQASVAAVDFETNSVDIGGKRREFPECV